MRLPQRLRLARGPRRHLQWLQGPPEARSRDLGWTRADMHFPRLPVSAAAMPSRRCLERCEGAISHPLQSIESRLSPRSHVREKPVGFCDCDRHLKSDPCKVGGKRRQHAPEYVREGEVAHLNQEARVRPVNVQMQHSLDPGARIL
jgi:hypothetical protein